MVKIAVYLTADNRQRVSFLYNINPVLTVRASNSLFICPLRRIASLRFFFIIAWLFKDSRRGRVFPVSRPRKGVREAVLEYRIVKTAGEMSLAEITLHTGRTHQIRVQFASRKHPLAGDGKYGSRVKGSIALQSCGLQFLHPETGKPMAFTLPLPEGAFWKPFEE